MHTRVSEIGQKHPGSVKDCSSLSICPCELGARTLKRFWTFWFYWTLWLPIAPFRWLDAIPFAVRCERRQHDREAKTRTLVEEAVSDNSPSASKQRGHSSHLPSHPIRTTSPFLHYKEFTLYACKNEKEKSLFITLFFFLVVVVVGAMMMDISGKCWSSYRLKSPFCEESVW